MVLPGMALVASKEDERRYYLEKRLREATTPQVFTAEEAQLLGMDISSVGEDWQDWMVKLTPDATKETGFFANYITPDQYEFGEDMSVKTPEGKQFTGEEWRIETGNLQEIEMGPPAPWQTVKAPETKPYTAAGGWAPPGAPAGVVVGGPSLWQGMAKQQLETILREGTMPWEEIIKPKILIGAEPWAGKRRLTAGERRQIEQSLRAMDVGPEQAYMERVEAVGLELEQNLESIALTRVGTSQYQYHQQNLLELLEEPGLTAEQRMRALGVTSVPLAQFITVQAQTQRSEEVVANLLKEYAPSITFPIENPWAGLEELGRIVEGDPNVFVDWVREKGMSEDFRQLVWAAVPEATAEDIDMIFGSIQSYLVQEAVVPLLPELFPALANVEPVPAIKWIGDNQTEFMERLHDIGETPESMALMRAFYPNNSDSQLREFFKEDTRGWFGKLVGAVVAGFGQAYTGVGGGLEWLGEGWGWLGAPFKYMGGGAVYYGKRMEEEAPTSSMWWSLASQIPLLATMFVAGAGTAALAGKVVTRLGITTATRMGAFSSYLIKVSGFAMGSRATETFMEAGGPYAQLRAQGVSRDEASGVAGEIFRRNLALIGMDIPQFLAIFLPFSSFKVLPSLFQKGLLRMIKPAVGAAFVSATEGFEEYYQEIVTNQAQDVDVKFWDLTKNLSEDEYKQVFLIGAAMGGMMAGGANVVSMIAKAVPQNLSGDVLADFNKTKADGIRQGMSREEAEMAALDVIAETAEGKKAIDDVMEAVRVEWYRGQIRPETAPEATIWNDRLNEMRPEGVVGIPPGTVQTIQAVRAKLGGGVGILKKLAIPEEDAIYQETKLLGQKIGFDVEAVEGIAEGEYWVSITSSSKTKSRHDQLIEWIQGLGLSEAEEVRLRQLINNRLYDLLRQVRAKTETFVEGVGTIKSFSFLPFKNIQDAEQFLKTGDPSLVAKEIKLRGVPWTEEYRAQVRQQLEAGKIGLPQEAVGPAIRKAPAKPVTEVRAELGAEGGLNIGDEARLISIDVVLANSAITSDNVRYEIFNAAKLKDKQAVVRVTDMDSGQVISLKKYPTYDQAEIDYNKGIKEPTEARPVPAEVLADYPELAGKAVGVLPAGYRITEVSGQFDIYRPDGKLAGTRATREAAIEYAQAYEAEFQLSIAAPVEGMPGVPTEPEVETVETAELTLTYEEANEQIQDIVKYYRQERADIEGVKAKLVKYIHESLPISERGRLLVQVRDVKNQAQLDKAMAKVDEIVEVYWQKNLKAQINKEIKKTKAKKVKGYLKGQFTAESQELLDHIRDNLKADRNEVRTKIADNIAKAERGELDQEVAYQANILLDMSGIEGMTASELQNALENIQSIKLTGKMLRQDKIDAENKRVGGIRANVINDVTGGKGLKPGVGVVDSKTLEEHKGLLDKITNWQYGLSDIMDKLSKFTKAKPYQSFLSKFVDTTIHSARITEGDAIQNIYAEVRVKLREIYGVKKTQALNKILNQMNEEIDLGTFKNRKGETVNLKITRNQAIKKYQEMLDPTLETTFSETMGWTYEMTNAVYNVLTEQDITWADYQMEFYQNYYDSINAIYKEMYGVNLPHNLHYSPIDRDVEVSNFPEHLLTFQDLARFASTKNPSLKARVGSRAPLKFTGANETFVNHINQMEHFKAWSGAISDMRRVFSNKETRTAIRQYHGRDILARIDVYINDLARGGVDRAKVNRVADKLRANFTKAILGLKPAIALKQIPSVMAYITDMPVGDFVTGVVDFWKNPINNYKELLEKSAYIRQRFGEGFERDIKFAMTKKPSQSLSGKGNFSDWFMTLIRMGDKLAVTQGMWAKYQSGIKAGLSPEQAMFEAGQLTERTQPTFTIESLSSLQNGGSFLKLMTMFQNQPNKYFRIMTNNARNFQYGRGSRTKAVSNIALAWIVLPAMFQLIADAFRFDREHQLRALVLGPLNFTLIAGQVFQSVYGWVTDEPFGYEVSPVTDSIDNLQKGFQKLSKFADSDEVNMDDVIKMVEFFAKAGGELAGLPTPYAIQVEGALRSGNYKELVFSRWALQEDTTKRDMLKKLSDAVEKLGEEIEVERVEGLEYIPRYYDMGNYRSVVGQVLKKIPPEDITIDNGFSALTVAAVESFVSEAAYKILPNEKLYKINADQADDYTYEDYYMQWRARQGITDPEKLKEFDELYPQAHLGNITKRQLELLREYHDTPEDEQDAFLENHPEIAANPREDWLRSHPEDNARLVLWGQGKILTEKAYNSLQGMMETLDVPDNLVPGIPPKKLAPAYFGYMDLLQDYGAGSSEALLHRLENDEFEKWGEIPGNMNVDGWIKPDNNIEVLRINVEYREQDDEYDGFKKTATTPTQLAREREAYLIEHSIKDDNYEGGYAEARMRRDAYKLEIPEEWIDTYVEYRQSGYVKGSLKGDQWLRMRIDFFNAVKDILDWEPLETWAGIRVSGGLPGMMFVPPVL